MWSVKCMLQIVLVISTSYNFLILPSVLSICTFYSSWTNSLYPPLSNFISTPFLMPSLPTDMKALITFRTCNKHPIILMMPTNPLIRGSQAALLDEFQSLWTPEVVPQYLGEYVHIHFSSGVRIYSFTRFLKEDYEGKVKKHLSLFLFSYGWNKFEICMSRSVQNFEWVEFYFSEHTIPKGSLVFPSTIWL